MKKYQAGFGLEPVEQMQQMRQTGVTVKKHLAEIEPIAVLAKKEWVSLELTSTPEQPDAAFGLLQRMYQIAMAVKGYWAEAELECAVWVH